MYQYEYENVECNMDGWGLMSGNVYEMGDYQSVINRRAREGWRYAGNLPVKQRGTGHVERIALIFEKEI